MSKQPSRHPIELFMPPNMLKAKMGGGIGGIDMAAVKRAQAALDTLKVQFTGWITSDQHKRVGAVHTLSICHDRIYRRRKRRATKNK